MNTTNRLAPRQQTFSGAITSTTMQTMIQKSLKDDRAAARFTSTLISAVNASDQLKACEPGTIVAAALRGEGMGLSLGMGYYLVPYGQTCTFIVGYKGLIALALATGQYSDIDCIDIREGEYKGRDRRTGKPSFDFEVYADDEEREKAKIIGYYAYFELKNGMFRSEYWNMDKLLKHADKYAQAFKLDKFNAFVNEELSEAETAKLKKSSPWYDVGGGQERMCKKTVLRSLLNSGYAPLSNEVRYVLSEDDEDGMIPDLPVLSVDRSTGEVIDPALAAIESAKDDDFFGGGNTVEEELKQREEAAQTTEATTEPKSQKKSQKNAAQAEDDFSDDGFFGMGEA